MDQQSRPQLRVLPNQKPVGVNADGQKLILTVPPGEGTDSGVVARCFQDLIQHHESWFHMRVLDTQFVIEQLRKDDWERLIIVAYVCPADSVRQVTHTLDMPGPFTFNVTEKTAEGIVVRAKVKKKD